MFLHITASSSVQTRVTKIVQIPREKFPSCAQKLKRKFPYEASMLPTATEVHKCNYSAWSDCNQCGKFNEIYNGLISQI